MYALDSNTVIYFFKGMGNVAVNLLQQPPSQIALPSVVMYELKVGIAKSVWSEKRTQQLDHFLATTRLLPFGKREAQIAAHIRADLERNGMKIGPYDVLIAATAIANQAILVTHNTREFGRIPNLQLEDWF